MSRVFLGLGSNLGNREQSIKSALRLINKLPFTSVAGISDFYYNPPMYGAVYDFVNAVCMIYTLLAPETLLIHLKRIERELGRKHKGQNLPRPIDIDILIYDDEKINLPDLVIPHPGIGEREFVLRPMQELCNKFFLKEIIPLYNKTTPATGR